MVKTEYWKNWVLEKKQGFGKKWILEKKQSFGKNRVLGDWRAAAGAMLCSQILSRNWGKNTHRAPNMGRKTQGP